MGLLSPEQQQGILGSQLAGLKAQMETTELPGKMGYQDALRQQALAQADLLRSQPGFKERELGMDKQKMWMQYGIEQRKLGIDQQIANLRGRSVGVDEATLRLKEDELNRQKAALEWISPEEWPLASLAPEQFVAAKLRQQSGGSAKVEYAKFVAAAKGLTTDQALDWIAKTNEAEFIEDMFSRMDPGLLKNPKIWQQYQSQFRDIYRSIRGTTGAANSAVRGSIPGTGAGGSSRDKYMQQYLGR
jgi:hypothetical protein